MAEQEQSFVEQKEENFSPIIFHSNLMCFVFCSQHAAHRIYGLNTPIATKSSSQHEEHI
jgi:hypothetical protein